MCFPSVVFLLFLAKFLGIFDFLALLSARSRRVLANREERIKKEILTASNATLLSGTGTITDVFFLNFMIK